jgi:hypothetical protein
LWTRSPRSAPDWLAPRPAPRTSRASPGFAWVPAPDRASVVTALCFLPCFYSLHPLAAAVARLRDGRGASSSSVCRCFSR